MTTRRRVLVRMGEAAVAVLAVGGAFRGRALGRAAESTAREPRIIHVAPDGQDEAGAQGGTSSNPWRTLPRAFAEAGPGDTIMMRGGVYGLDGAASGWLLAGHGGLPDAPIVVTNAPGETPILDGGGMAPPTTPYAAWPSRTDAGGFPLVLWDVPHVVLQGLTVRRGPMGGCYVNGAHPGLVVERCTFHENGWLNDEYGTGLALLGSGENNVVRNCDSFGNGGFGENTTGRNADGFSFVLHGSRDLVVEGNRAWRNTDDGFDFFNAYPAESGLDASPCLVDRNWAFENGSHADGRLATSPRADGNGFKLGGRREGATGAHGGHTVTRCLAWNNKCSGFDDNGYGGGLSPLMIFNNVSFNNGRNVNREQGDPGFAFIVQFAAETVLRNNIAFATEGRNALRILLASHSHNLRNGPSWDQLTPPVTLSARDFVSLDDAIARGPRAPDGSLPVSGFLRLRPGSGLIGRGRVADLPPHLRAPTIDIGAFAGC